MSGRYEAGRALSAAAAQTWAAIVSEFVPNRESPRILDLGAGTGRFSTVFAESLDATVVGVEPSTGMLAVAESQRFATNVFYMAGTADHIPLASATCDMAWLSHVWHHFPDRQACVNDLSRILRSGGHVLVRGTFGDQLEGFPTLFRFWPATRGICQQLPTVGETVDLFERSDFTLVEHRHVQQETAASLRDFAARRNARADSALKLISDSEFTAVQAAIETAAASDLEGGAVIEVIELLVLRKGMTEGAGC